MNSKKPKKSNSNTVAVNKKARHDFFIEKEIEAGLVLQGWEVKSLRAGRCHLTESYVLIKNSEAWLFGAHVTPLPTASTHIHPDPTRTRKLLLNIRELSQLIGQVERKGYTLVALKIYWVRGLAKLKIGLAKGKKQFDKRAIEKDRDWQRSKARMFKESI